MTITYDLEVTTNLTPAAFVRLLFSRINVPIQLEHFNGIYEIKTPNFEISAFGDVEDAISEDMGIRPDVVVEFRPRPLAHAHVRGLEALLNAIDAWLRELDNDFIMIYNGAIIMMYRKDGRLVLNRACPVWTDERRALLKFPYDMVSIPGI